MKHLKLILVFLILSKSWSFGQKEGMPMMISQPVTIDGDAWSLKGSQNILLVPENRNDPQSRLIGLHYFHFPAKEKSKLPPLAFLGAGPGEPYDLTVFNDGKRAEAWRFELEFVNQKRDVVLINQRGNPDAPGIQINDFWYRWWNGGSYDQAFDLTTRNENRKKAYAKAIESFTALGVDLKGYDIHHFVDDIEAVRKAIGADKLAFIGNSFASQWALGYIQKYPNNVDRAIFSGVEPLDHNYDDPQGIWNVFERIDGYAKKDTGIMHDLPPGGLTEVFKKLIKRLESEAETVVLENNSGAFDTIVVGPDDLRFMPMNNNVRSYKEEIESWPKYLMEMYHGDFRYLAALSRGRKYNSRDRMINQLFNNSLGISKEREEQLNERPAKRWLGDINSSYTSTRDICPATKVSSRFRQHVEHNIPIILIQGDMDLSTPYENAGFLMNYLPNGHLITVKGGFHNAKRALIFEDRVLANQIFEFMNIDFEVIKFREFKENLPSEFNLDDFEFWKIDSDALFIRWLKRNK